MGWLYGSREAIFGILGLAIMVTILTILGGLLMLPAAAFVFTVWLAALRAMPSWAHYLLAFAWTGAALMIGRTYERGVWGESRTWKNGRDAKTRPFYGGGADHHGDTE